MQSDEKFFSFRVKRDTCQNSIADMIFTRSYHENMKDYFHPNVRKYIELRGSDYDDDCIYLRPFHSCNHKTRRGRKKSILYRNGNLCLLGGEFHPGIIDVRKFIPLVQYTRYMSFVDEKVKFLYKSKGDYIYNFKTGKYDHLSDKPIRDRYLQFVKSKNVYLNSHKQL